jgi:uncharacterized protein YjiS (DUF1127 family)
MERIMRNITLPLTQPRMTQSRGGLGRTAGQIWHFIAALEFALQVRKERRLLADLDARTLKDLGFDRGAAGTEARRTFWDLPTDRLRT